MSKCLIITVTRVLPKSIFNADNCINEELADILKWHVGERGKLWLPTDSAEGCTKSCLKGACGSRFNYDVYKNTTVCETDYFHSSDKDTSKLKEALNLRKLLT